MTPSEIEYHLRELHEIDVDNLKAGRITRQAMKEAMDRVQAYMGLMYANRLREGKAAYPRHLADELNNMLQAAREDGE